MLLFLLAATLALLVAGVALPKASVLAPVFWVHLVLAVGVMSLISAAMQHFVPVLTRGRGAGRWLGRLPWVMAAAGLLSLPVFLGYLPWGMLSLAAGLGLSGVTAMLLWMHARGRQTLGRPHPGLAWYLAAVACLGAGLNAAALIPWLPEWHVELREFHSHINLYGFIGLTAIGTLQVLLPTAAGRPDPEAGMRLRLDLKWALAGALLLATGKAVGLDWLVWAGVGAWLWPLGRMALAWGRLYRREILAWHGQTPVLMAALLGYASALILNLELIGVSNGPLGVFLPAFLFPLVSGAAGQLAPVWALPGQGSAQHAASRASLSRHGGLRAGLFLTAALLPLLGLRCAGMPGLTAMIWFLVLFAVWLYRV
jgi:hypothetical protein